VTPIYDARFESSTPLAPLLGPLFGVAALRQTMRARFEAMLREIESLPLVRDLSALGLPSVTAAELAELVGRHAPRLEIETAGDEDRPGALVWPPDGVGGERLVVTAENRCSMSAAATRKRPTAGCCS
jgi:hypothetical protein